MYSFLHYIFTILFCSTMIIAYEWLDREFILSVSDYMLVWPKVQQSQTLKGKQSAKERWCTLELGISLVVLVTSDILSGMRGRLGVSVSDLDELVYTLPTCKHMTQWHMVSYVPLGNVYKKTFNKINHIEDENIF